MEWYNSINTIHTVFNVRIKEKGKGSSVGVHPVSVGVHPVSSQRHRVISMSQLHNMQQKYGTAARATAKETIMPGP